MLAHCTMKPLFFFKSQETNTQKSEVLRSHGGQHSVQVKWTSFLYPNEAMGAILDFSRNTAQLTTVLAVSHLKS